MQVVKVMQVVQFMCLRSSVFGPFHKIFQNIYYIYSINKTIIVFLKKIS